MNRTLRIVAFPLLLAGVLPILGCGSGTDGDSGAPVIADAADTLVGTWRATLASPGGPLPFTLRFTESEGGVDAVVLNGEEEAPTSGVSVDGSNVTVAFDFYDSAIDATVSEDGTRLAGTWRRTGEAGAQTVLDFAAVRGDTDRFKPGDAVGAENAVASVAGVWSTVFVDEDGQEPARGQLEQDGDRVTGTFLTPTGDYRFLEGTYENGLLRLSTFDGAHAFLFHARGRDDGGLEGDFWSRDTYHATWTATPAEADARVLPDPWTQASLTNDEGLFRFAFPDLEGNTVRHDDPRFAGKVVAINIFGSWCPNCNDDAPLLGSWDRRFGDQGLAIVGLAFEFTGDVERDRRQVRRFSDRHGLRYPMLLAGGTSDKADAAALLPDLDRVVAYPTTVFVGRDGRVRKIYSGFAGPGTGEAHAEMVAELEGLLAELLAEPVPESGSDPASNAS